jgi:hypothetical protein
MFLHHCINIEIYEFQLEHPSILCPAEKVLSITFPLVTLLIFVRTNAGPFPGLRVKIQ